jgi:hypothetical protein
MSRPMKLYNHSLAPNPRRVRIFAAEKGINLTLEEVDILAGQSRTPDFLQRTRQAGCRCWSWMTVRIFPNRLRSAGIWRDFIPSRTF